MLPQRPASGRRVGGRNLGGKGVRRRPLGDARLSQRLVTIADAKADDPGRAFCGVAQGDWAAVKGYYRLIDTPADSAVTMAHILQPHRDRTVRRMQGQRTVLCVQDGSDLDYTGLAACAGLGEIGTNQTGAKSRGLHLHSTVAIAPNGLPLGVLRAQCRAPASKAPEDTRPTFAIPIEEKKTFPWIEHHRDLVALAADMPQTRLIDVCDREADFFELFDEQRAAPGVELLVRAKYNRNITEEPFKLWESGPADAGAESGAGVSPAAKLPGRSAANSRRVLRGPGAPRSWRCARCVSSSVRHTTMRQASDGYWGDSCAGGASTAEHPRGGVVPADDDRDPRHPQRPNNACAGTACAGA